MLQSIPASLQRWGTILLPPLALLACCAVMVPKQKKLREINKDVVATQAGVQMYLKQLQDIADLPKDPTIATMPFTKEEQSDFLRGLTQLCSQGGNRIVSVSSLAAPRAGPPSTSGQPNPGAEAGVPPDVQAIKSTIVFQGNFDSMRRFLYGLNGSRRLISMNECRIGPGTGGFPLLLTSVTVTRYVDAPDNVAAPPPAPVKT